MLKRSFDIVAASLLLILVGPAMLAAGVAVKLDSRGPILYRGARAGRNGRPFRIMKFRTMVEGAETLGGGTTALGDPRITRVGRYLRRTKLDEMPQLVNVIVGDMSLVGPRPELLQYVEQYSAEEQQILTVRPGITDYSSLEFSSLDSVVGATNADAVYEERVLPRKNRLRLRYVQEQTFLGDVRLLLLTIRKVLGKAIAG